MATASGSAGAQEESEGDMTNGDAQERTVVMEVSQVELREQIIRVEGRMDVLEAKIDSLNERMNERMDGFEKRMDGFEKRMDRLETRMDRLEAKMDRLLYAMVAITIANAGTIVAVIAT